MEEKLDLAPFDEWIKTVEIPEETYFFEFDEVGNVIALHPGFVADTIKHKVQVDLDTALGIYERGEMLGHYKVEITSGRILKVNLASITGLNKIDDVLHRVIDKRWSNITKPDIAIEYDREESVLTFKINPLLKTVEWQGDQDMVFLVTAYNDPNILQEMISFNVNELVKYPHRFKLELPKKFSIYTRRIFDKYTYEDIRT
jgi:hypothetical protein